MHGPADAATGAEKAAGVPPCGSGKQQHGPQASGSPGGRRLRQAHPYMEKQASEGQEARLVLGASQENDEAGMSGMQLRRPEQ